MSVSKAILDSSAMDWKVIGGHLKTISFSVGSVLAIVAMIRTLCAAHPSDPAEDSASEEEDSGHTRLRPPPQFDEIQAPGMGNRVERVQSSQPSHPPDPVMKKQGSVGRGFLGLRDPFFLVPFATLMPFWAAATSYDFLKETTNGTNKVLLSALTSVCMLTPGFWWSGLKRSVPIFEACASQSHGYYPWVVVQLSIMTVVLGASFMTDHYVPLHLGGVAIIAFCYGQLWPSWMNIGRSKDKFKEVAKGNKWSNIGALCISMLLSALTDNQTSLRIMWVLAILLQLCVLCVRCPEMNAGSGSARRVDAEGGESNSSSRRSVNASGPPSRFRSLGTVVAYMVLWMAYMFTRADLHEGTSGEPDWLEDYRVRVWDFTMKFGFLLGYELADPDILGGLGSSMFSLKVWIGLRGFLAAVLIWMARRKTHWIIVLILGPVLMSVSHGLIEVQFHRAMKAEEPERVQTLTSEVGYFTGLAVASAAVFQFLTAFPPPQD